MLTKKLILYLNLNVSGVPSWITCNNALPFPRGSSPRCPVGGVVSFALLFLADDIWRGGFRRFHPGTDYGGDPDSSLAVGEEPGYSCSSSECTAPLPHSPTQPTPDTPEALSLLPLPRAPGIICQKCWISCNWCFGGHFGDCCQKVGIPWLTIHTKHFILDLVNCQWNY